MKKNKSAQKFKPIYARYTDLTNTREHIFLANSSRLPWKKPEPLKNQRAKRDPSKFCRFHKDIGHNNDDCRHLKVEIETLIRVGPLAQYARNWVNLSQPVGQTLLPIPEALTSQPGAQAK